MRYNHGGGYQYRLCPAEKMPCTEQDFQQIPLDFVRSSHAIMWNNGTLFPIPGKFVDDSVCAVVPKGSTWARNPVPRIHTDNVGMAYVGNCLQTHGIFPSQDDYCSPNKDDCQQFPTPCPDQEGVAPGEMGNWYMSNGVNESAVPDRNTHEGACSGDWTLGMISDEVVIPKTLTPGKYVLSWRWDCEETAQVPSLLPFFPFFLLPPLLAASHPPPCIITGVAKLCGREHCCRGRQLSNEERVGAPAKRLCRVAILQSGYPGCRMQEVAIYRQQPAERTANASCLLCPGAVS
jgi:hypothetical protein